ncbi:MAG: hypothetical protein ACLFPR_08025, partial [Desulfococcaceae bacterium]
FCEKGEGAVAIAPLADPAFKTAKRAALGRMGLLLAQKRQASFSMGISRLARAGKLDFPGWKGLG